MADFDELTPLEARTAGLGLAVLFSPLAYVSVPPFLDCVSIGLRSGWRTVVPPPEWVSRGIPLPAWQAALNTGVGAALCLVMVAAGLAALLLPEQMQVAYTRLSERFSGEL